MKDRILVVVSYVIVVPIMFVCAIILLGFMMETVAENSAQHDRCLKQATNGYEIQRCR